VKQREREYGAGLDEGLSRLHRIVVVVIGWRKWIARVTRRVSGLCCIDVLTVSEPAQIRGACDGTRQHSHHQRAQRRALHERDLRQSAAIGEGFAGVSRERR
jgi:hypothetical protein